jgi:hypothetical protein
MWHRGRILAESVGSDPNAFPARGLTSVGGGLARRGTQVPIENL